MDVTGIEPEPVSILAAFCPLCHPRHTDIFKRPICSFEPALPHTAQLGITLRMHLLEGPINETVLISMRRREKRFSLEETRTQDIRKLRSRGEYSTTELQQPIIWRRTYFRIDRATNLLVRCSPGKRNLKIIFG